MAVAPQLSPFEIVDLRLVRARELGPLLEEEQRLWAEELHWDYQPSAEMIRKHVDSRSLPGLVARREGCVAGYCFFVHEDSKGLLGDLYVLEAYRRERPYGTSAGIATLLLERALEMLEQSPRVRRIESQLIPQSGVEPLAPVFLAHGFRSFPRLFMYKQIPPGQPRARKPPGAPPAVELRTWQDSYFEPMAELIVAAYRGHPDSQINDQYSQDSGALRFLKNIVIFPGCGVFQLESSLVAVEAGGSQRLLGAVLTSQVAPGIAHVTQLCVGPEWRRQGLGRALMETALERLAARGYRGVSLTVTAENEPAVRLYRQLGFDLLKGFSAFARTLR